MLELLQVVMRQQVQVHSKSSLCMIENLVPVRSECPADTQTLFEVDLPQRDIILRIIKVAVMLELVVVIVAAAVVVEEEEEHN
jgi:hypothetical protein